MKLKVTLASHKQNGDPKLEEQYSFEVLSAIWEAVPGNTDNARALTWQFLNEQDMRRWCTKFDQFKFYSDDLFIHFWPVPNDMAVFFTVA